MSLGLSTVTEALTEMATGMTGRTRRPPRSPAGRRVPTGPYDDVSQEYRHRHPPMRLVSHHTPTVRLITPLTTIGHLDLQASSRARRLRTYRSKATRPSGVSAK